MTLRKTLLLTGILVGLAFCAGSATAQSDLEAAQTDSIVNAFYLLQFDMRVAEAKAGAHAQLDSLRIVDLQLQLKEARLQRYRDLGVFGVAVVVAGLIFWAGSRAD